MTFCFTVPSGPPENISGLFTAFGSFQLEWSPPSEENRNGNITGYVLQLERGNERFERLNTSDTSYIFTGLQQGTYYCSIAAQTSVGTGPFSNKIAGINKQSFPPADVDHTAIISGSSAGVFVALLLICLAMVFIAGILKWKRKQ